MRHNKKGFKLGRTSSHRKATLSAMSTALIQHKRITTTLTKARALRMYIEPVITRAKDDSTHNRREVFRHLQNKYAVTELFNEVGPKVGDRPGGYTRIVKLGQRAGDSAEMAIIELVDYNDVRPDGSSSGGKKRTRRAGRSRRAAAPVAAEAVEETVEHFGEDAADASSDAVEAATDAVEEVAEAATDTPDEADVDAAEEVAQEAAPAVAEAVAEEAATEEAPAAAASEEAPAAKAEGDSEADKKEEKKGDT